MKNNKAGLILIVIIIVIIGIMFLIDNNHKNKFPSQTSVFSSTPAPTSTNKPTASKYSAAVKAKVRNEFISNCQTKGHYSAIECNCAADYLAKNYTESELANIYLQYRNSSQVPAALEAASKACVIPSSK
jgi:hypothetical protein